MKTKSLILSALLIASPMSLSASGLSGEATEFTQIANNVQLVLQYATQIEQYQTQLNSLTQDIQHTSQMAQNLAQLPAASWNKFQNDVLALKNIVQQGQAVSFAATNLDSQFASVYKGYSNFQSLAGAVPGTRNASFSQQYKTLNASTRDSVNGALKALNTQMSAMNSDESVMNMLQQQSRSADGEVKATQAANEIAMHQTDTLKKLQYTLMTQASTEAQWIASQNDAQAAQQALAKQRLSTQKTQKAGGRTLDSFIP
jgi:P-type conjugative transfer protein TrbJ